MYIRQHFQHTLLTNLHGKRDKKKAHSLLLLLAKRLHDIVSLLIVHCISKLITRARNVDRRKVKRIKRKRIRQKVMSKQADQPASRRYQFFNYTIPRKLCIE